MNTDRATTPFHLAEVTVYPEGRTMVRNDKILDVPGHYVAVLIRLAEEALIRLAEGRLAKEPLKTVHRNELKRAMGEGQVTDDVLNKAVQELRLILGSGAIGTERTHGYRLLKIPEFDTPSETAKAELSPSEYAQSQLTLWTDGDGGEPGIHLNRRDGVFIPWSKLLPEIAELLKRVERLPLGCTAQPASYKGRPNYDVYVFDPEGNKVANIWLGVNPDNHYRFDGLVHIGREERRGKAVVWDVFQRYSDGGYRRKAKY
jgi:hypothetical protein